MSKINADYSKKRRKYLQDNPIVMQRSISVLCMLQMHITNMAVVYSIWRIYMDASLQKLSYGIEEHPAEAYELGLSGSRS